MFDTAEIATFTPQEKIRLKNDMRTERDLRNQIAYAYDKGREDERTKIEERLRNIEEELRKKGMSDEEIAKLFEN